MGRKRKNNTQLKLPPRVYFKNNAFHFVGYDNRWQKLTSDIKQVWDKYYEVTGEVQNVAVVRHLFARYFKEVAPETIGAESLKIERYRAKPLLKAFGDWKPIDVHTRALYQYLDARSSKIAANREIRLMKKVFDCAIKWGYVDKNPARFMKLHAEKPRDRHVTLREFVAVKRMAYPAIAAIMEFAFLTAARQSEILAFKCDHIKPDGILLHTTKTGGEIFFIEYSNRLKKLIDKHKHDGEFLFLNQSKKPYTTTGFKSCWQRLMNKALETGAIKERFTFHDIRAMAVTYVANREGLEEARSLAGHKTSVMTGRVYYRGVKQRRTTL
jgi:integrase